MARSTAPSADEKMVRPVERVYEIEEPEIPPRCTLVSTD